MQQSKSTLSELKVRLILGIVGSVLSTIIIVLVIVFELSTEKGIMKLSIMLLGFILSTMFGPSEMVKLKDSIIGIFTSKK